MRFRGTYLISPLVLLLGSSIGLGGTQSGAAHPCPELLPRIREQLEVTPSQSRLHALQQQKSVSAARRTALDTIEFVKSSGFTQLPDSKVNGLYQRVLKYRNDPDFQAALKEDAENWARMAPLVRRLVATPAGRAALDTLEFIQRSGFTEVPNSKADDTLYARYLKYRDDPEFQSVLKEQPQAWALLERLLKRRDTPIKLTAKQSALDTLEFMKGSGFTQVPSPKTDNALYQRLHKFLDDSEFQAVLKENPQAWALIEPMLKRKDFNAARQAALDTIQFLESSEFARLPSTKTENALYQRFRKFLDNSEFQATLKENPEAWALVAPLLRRRSVSPAGKAALDTLEFIQRSGFTEVPSFKADDLLYSRFLRYQNDPEFQAVLKEQPQAWSLVEPLLKRRPNSPAK
jgi:hypothetical protein